MDRRRFLAQLAAATATDLAVARAAAPRTTRLAAAWRGLATDADQQVGAIGIDWDARTVRIASSVTVPSRAHGLLAEPDGGWLAVAFRPGAWLWRFDAEGRVAARVSTDDEGHGRRFCGHVVASPDGRCLFTTELDTATGAGRIGVRDRRTLRKLDDWPSGGLDPHQATCDRQGRLIVANGGLPRTPDGRKHDLDRMDSSLVAIDTATGTRVGQWRLGDRRLGLRHLAWSAAPDGSPLLGIALQAEHDDPARRAGAPVLAIWDGSGLAVPSTATDGEGYAGDIALAEGGFVLTCQHARLALHWDAARGRTMSVVARLREVCAVSPVAAHRGGVAVAAALGVGRWHPGLPAELLRWPAPIALDNHWVEIGPA